MSRHIIDLDAPDRFIAAMDEDDEGCYLVAVRGRRRASVSLERQQLALVARGALVLVGELERRGLVALDMASSPADARADGPPGGWPAAPPPRHLFDAGTLSVTWDDDGERLIVEARAMHFDAGVGECAPPPHVDADPETDELPDDDPLGPDVLRVRLTPLMAQRFARQAARVASADRAVCPTCRRPLDGRPHRC
jgi:uncharacterized repeat protein (TIGR03847 family)